VRGGADARRERKCGVGGRLRPTDFTLLSCRSWAGVGGLVLPVPTWRFKNISKSKTFKARPTLNTQHSTLHTQHSTLNTEPSTLNTQPSTLNPQPSTLNTQLVWILGMHQGLEYSTGEPLDWRPSRLEDFCQCAGANWTKSTFCTSIGLFLTFPVQNRGSPPGFMNLWYRILVGKEWSCRRTVLYEASLRQPL